ASCHEGMAFADGVSGVLVWGGGDTINLTVGRADLWDHRGGYPWTEEQSYTNIVAAVRSGNAERLYGLFKKTTPPGEPNNPFMLPLGRIVITVRGATLRRGELDPMDGTGFIEFEHGGDIKRVEMAMSKKSGAFAMEFPDGIGFSATAKSAMEFERARNALAPIGYLDAEKWSDGDEAGGFLWRIPCEGDKPVSLGWARTGRNGVTVATARGESPARATAEYAKVASEAREQWAEFWREGARVEVPDPVIQRCFDYGMYRAGIMTDFEGVPAGLQGAWLEDDRLVPWNGDYHFNINVQECYSPNFRGGHFKNLMPLFRMVLSWRPLLRDNAKKFCGIDDGYVLPHSVDDRGVCIGGFWTGTIDHASTAWVAAMMMKYVRYSGDIGFLRSDAYDFMKGAMNVYRAMMEEYDGRLSIPLAPSPEWGAADVRMAVGRDPSFQLAAAHRLARDLIEAAALLGEAADPMWADVDRRLPAFSSDESGITLFEGQRLTESHRHHSHMAGLYPFNTIDFDNNRDTVASTFYTWVNAGTGQWTGWCVPWASILNTHVGNAKAAAELLRCWDNYFCNPGHGSLHNSYSPGFSTFTIFGSFCGSGDGQVMQMDGQCAAATAVMEMMVHETYDRLDLFKGCPDEWKTVRFENIALVDGRRLSAERVDGEIRILEETR
ncbi:MAG: hypothetical protein ILO34_02555, partial [Kiritimatiellae bacterium]|nr:hypothetical protein [Kiritimatiellia bacterium]